MDTRAARPFSFSFNTSDYRVLLMDQDQGRLYLGSREYLVALDMQNVNKEPLIVRTTTPVSFFLNPACYLVCGIRSLNALILCNPLFSGVLWNKQIHWPASAKRKGECQMTGKGKQVRSCIYILFFQKSRTPVFKTGTKITMLLEFHLSYSSLSRVNAPTLCGW